MAMKHITIWCLSVLCGHVYAVPDLWEQTHYVWDFGLISATDKGLNKDPRQYFIQEHTFEASAYQNLKTNDVVWLRCRFIPQFYEQILPALSEPIVLVISDGDESFPSDCGMRNIESLLDNPYIKHVFAQNCDHKGPSSKVTHWPIGMDFHTIAYKGTRGGWGEMGSPCQQEQRLMNIIQTLKPTSQRIKKAFVDFQHADTMRAEHKRYLQFGEDRTTIFNRLLLTGLIDHAGWMRRSLLWAKKGEYAFSISPHGNGLDCHRTWEDMVLGCIVIVKTSPLDPLYEGLPVVIVKDWSEITSENLDKWLVQYGDAFTNPAYREKLTNTYWMSKIRAEQSK